MNSIEKQTQSAVRVDAVEPSKPPVFRAPIVQKQEIDVSDNEEVEEEIKKEPTTGEKISRSFFDRYVDKIKDFLDNAE